MTWVKIIWLVLTILEWMVRIAEENKYMNLGEQKAVAKQLAEILRKSEYGRKMLVDAEQLSDDQLDAGLRDLEPR